MPALIFILALAILFKVYPGSVFVPVFFWALITHPLSDAVLSFCRAVGLHGNWAINITLAIDMFLVATLASYLAWKWLHVPSRRSLYFNLFILVVGIPAATMIGLAITHVPT